MPYMVMALVCLGVHGILVTNDGVVWDGWYFYTWLKRTRNIDSRFRKGVLG